jgi:hypothetical protein
MGMTIPSGVWQEAASVASLVFSARSWVARSVRIWSSWSVMCGRFRRVN